MAAQYDILIVQDPESWDVTMTATSEHGRRYFAENNLEEEHDISEIHPNDLMPELQSYGLVVAIKFGEEPTRFPDKFPLH